MPMTTCVIPFVSAGHITRGGADLGAAALMDALDFLYRHRACCCSDRVITQLHMVWEVQQLC
jgi:hypothetical protein